MSTAVSPRPNKPFRGEQQTRKKADELRSHRWFGMDDLRAFGHRSRAKQMGYSTADFAGKPVIAIINTWSDLNACHMHLRQRAEEVKRGVWQAGGFPIYWKARRPRSAAGLRRRISPGWKFARMM